MSQVHALSDDQVSLELKKMTAFIKQEASEKAQEIKIKADEEFSIEKTKLRQQEIDTIDNTYTKKFKQATMSQQITRSKVANQTRLKVLGARQELLDDIFETTQQKLSDAAKDKKRYEGILKGLILEGFYEMNEPEVHIRARKVDYPLVKKAIATAAEEYKDKTDKDVSAEIDEENPVAEGSTGGVVIVGTGGKIDLNNTFEARLDILRNSALPAMREALFGKNPNRKFFD